jgi:hypothetical protein
MHDGWRKQANQQRGPAAAAGSSANSSVLKSENNRQQCHGMQNQQAD